MLRCCLSAVPRLAFDGAGLLLLRTVVTLKAYLDFAYVDCVAVNDARRAGDVGKRGYRQQYKKYQNKDTHREILAERNAYN